MVMGMLLGLMAGIFSAFIAEFLSRVREDKGTFGQTGDVVYSYDSQARQDRSVQQVAREAAKV